MTTETPDANESTDASDATPGADSTTESNTLRPRTGPIIWGALVLAFCVYVAQRAVAPHLIDTTTWLIAGVIGLGVLLLGVGVAVLLRGRDRR